MILPAGYSEDTSDPFSVSNITAFNNFVNDLENDLMPYIENNFSVLTGRENTAICGFSMGGMESLDIGFKRLDRFAYIGAFSPAPSLDTSVLHISESSENDIKLLLLCTGTDDTIVGDTPQIYHDVLDEEGVEHIWYQVSEGTHSFNVWNHGLYNFVKRLWKN